VGDGRAGCGSIQATIVSLQENAQSSRQGDRRPNAKPRHCQRARPDLRAPPVGCGVRSPPAICRIDGTTTERTSVSSLLVPESQPRRAHDPSQRETEGPVSATAIRTLSPNRGSTMECLPARLGSPPNATCFRLQIEAVRREPSGNDRKSQRERPANAWFPGRRPGGAAGFVDRACWCGWKAFSCQGPVRAGGALAKASVAGLGRPLTVSHRPCRGGTLAKAALIVTDKKSNYRPTRGLTSAAPRQSPSRPLGQQPVPSIERSHINTSASQHSATIVLT
jgi:hypothetical protein